MAEIDVDEVLSDTTVPQDERHAPGCDGSCGADEVIEHTKLILALSAIGLPEIAAAVAMDNPIAGALALSVIHDSKATDES